MESKSIQVPGGNINTKAVNHYIDILSWQKDFSDRDVSIVTLIKTLYDELSTALIGSLVYNTDPKALERIKSAYMSMLDGVRDNVEQVDPEIVEKLKKNEPDLF